MSSDRRLFTLEVALFSGPVTKAFLAVNPHVSRTIQIRADQTLETLHRAIFDAFDREDEHLYEFQIGGRGPGDPEARRYCLCDADDPSAAGSVRVAIGQLGLDEGDVFGYWFDFGDEWWHQINVVKIESHCPGGSYPRVIGRVGNSPPQYVDWDEVFADGEGPEDDYGSEGVADLSDPLALFDVLNDDLSEEELADIEARRVARMSYDASLPFEELARQVPIDRTAQFMEIVNLVTDFCDRHLTEDYRQRCRAMAAIACAKALPGPRQKAAGWAAAIIYVMGWVNHLDDPGSEPYVRTSEIPKAFQVSAATMYNNAHLLEISLGISPFDPHWYVSSPSRPNPILKLAHTLDMLLDRAAEKCGGRRIQEVPQPEPPREPPRLRYVPGRQGSPQEGHPGNES